MQHKHAAGQECSFHRQETRPHCAGKGGFGLKRGVSSENAGKSSGTRLCDFIQSRARNNLDALEFLFASQRQHPETNGRQGAINGQRTHGTSMTPLAFLTPVSIGLLPVDVACAEDGGRRQ
jgi:hypothetical protein